LIIKATMAINNSTIKKMGNPSQYFQKLKS
jgi:hypothetical protein